VLDAPRDLQIPIGPTGILVGAALRDDKSGWPEIPGDDLVMWALTDPRQPARIVTDTSEFYVRQPLIRAAAAGERIAIYSYDPRRWYSVSQPNIAVVERGRPAEFVPTIIVNEPAPDRSVGRAVLDGDHVGAQFLRRRGARHTVSADLGVDGTNHHSEPKPRRGHGGVPPRANLHRLNGTRSRACCDCARC
jgi:hypothetical protein